MADKKKPFVPAVEFTTGKGTAYFCYIVKPDTEGQYADGKFKLNVRFPADTDFSDLDEAVQRAAVAEWGKAPKGLKGPYVEVDEDSKDVERDAANLGTFVMRAKSKFRPTIYGPKKELLYSAKRDRDEVPEEARVSSGDLVQLRIALIPNTAGGNKQVSPRLLAIRIIEKRSGGQDHDYSGAFGDDDEGGEEPTRQVAASKGNVDEQPDF